MNQANKQLLEDEITAEFNTLKEMDLGSESYKVTVDQLTKLIDRSISLEKMEIDVKDKAEDREIDMDYKTRQFNSENSYKVSDIALRQTQMDNDKRDKLIVNVMTAAGIIIPSVITIWGTCKSLKFEEQGTVTTIVGRGFINKLLPKK